MHAPYSQQSNQTMNEERLMRDFPKHNWLFNKYNITDVAVDTDNVMVSSRRKKRKRRYKLNVVSLTGANKNFAMTLLAVMVQYFPMLQQGILWILLLKLVWCPLC